MPDLIEPTADELRYAHLATAIAGTSVGRIAQLVQLSREIRWPDLGWLVFSGERLEGDAIWRVRAISQNDDDHEATLYACARTIPLCIVVRIIRGRPNLV